jgi:hypothetical protein
MTMAGKHALRLVMLSSLAITLAGFAPRAMADDEDPPSRIARLAYAQGSVSFQPAGTNDWVTAGLNRPVTTGDRLWCDNDGRTELQLDGSLIRLSNNTGFSFLNLSDRVTQIQLSSGTLLVRVRRLDDNETYEIDTPNLAFSVLRPGVYRVNVNEAGDSTAIKIRSGEGEVTGGGAAYTVHANNYDTFSGTDQLSASSETYRDDQDQFDSWAATRDRHWDNSNSSRYVSADVVGYEDLDDHGSWRHTPDNGNVWFPRTSVQDWAPYHYGHWDYIEPWGYTWVDNEPWGFAPFHYGRWVSYEGSWGWVPAPPRVEGAVYVRPVYAPALVAWVGGPHFAIGVGSGEGYAAGVNVGWFPLGPREVYVPSYRVSRNYVNNVNISNTTVNTTVVNNYYNTTVVNNNVNVTNVKYVNQSVPGAVAATTPQAFTSAQPVAKNAVKVDQREVASAPVRAFTPAAVPAKQAVLGTAASAAKPPAAVQSRAVVAKVAPPPPPPTFEKRQEAIKINGGKPLSVVQVRQIQPVAAHTAAPVRIAPVAAAKPVAVAPQTSQTNRPGQPQNVQPAPAAPNAANKPVETPSRPADRPGQPQNTQQPQSNRPVATTPTPQAVAPNSTRPPDRPAERPVPPNTAKPVESKQVAPTAVQPPNRPADRPADRPVPPSAAKPVESKPVAPTAVQPPNRPPDHPVDRPTNPNSASQPAPGNRPASPPVHASEVPVPPRPVVPPSANAPLDAKHQQEQNQLHANQQQERQAVQQQQEQEHAKLAQQQADAAKKQQVEQQHQQQTQQLQQKHADEQKVLQEKQKQERQAQPKPKKEDPPPPAKP